MKININLDTKEVVISIEDTTQEPKLPELIPLGSTSKEYKKTIEYFKVIDECYVNSCTSYQTIIVYTQTPTVMYLLNDHGLLTLFRDLETLINNKDYVCQSDKEQDIDNFLMSLYL